MARFVRLSEMAVFVQSALATTAAVVYFLASL
jgi:hypothetical protein